jgi:hypothetical protein
MSWSPKTIRLELTESVEEVVCAVRGAQKTKSVMAATNSLAKPLAFIPHLLGV